MTHDTIPSAAADDLLAALPQRLHGGGEMPQTTPTCDVPDCTGPRQVLLMEPAMRCICRRCWRMMGDDAIRRAARRANIEVPE